MGRTRAFRALNVTMVVLFVVSAGLQYNDPDPWRWAALYLGGALAGGVRRGWLFPAVVGLVALGWAAALAPATLPGFRLADLAQTMKAGTPQIELSRELLGLVIVAAWMTVLVVVALRTRRPQRA